MELSKILGNVKVRYIVYGLLFLFLILTTGLTLLSVDFFVQYSSLFIGLTKAVIGILVLTGVDDVIFSSIDTTTAIKEKNISYALFYLANAIIIAACIGFA